jgi:hypothetical protein
MDALFSTQRTKLIEAYKKAGQSFQATTKPYKSTRSLVWTAGFLAAADHWGILHCAKGQKLEFFNYGIGDDISAGGVTKRATESDTNVVKGSSTNGAEDFVIEGFSATARGTRMRVTGNGPAVTGGLADVLAGKGILLDPAALVTPPQVSSPFNLENTLYSAVAPYLAMEIMFDRKRIEKIYNLDELAEGGGKSYLRANGEPRSDNRARSPEGYLWRRDGQPDSELVVTLTLTEDVAVPINLVTIPSTELGAATDVTFSDILVDIMIRAHGISVNLPSKN